MSRAERVGELIKVETSKLLQAKITDPRIGFVSIIDVDVSPDLKYAKIYVSILGDEEAKKKSMQGLASATHYIRNHLGQTLELRLVPDITFKRDDSLERGSHLLEVMKEVEEERRKQATSKIKKRKTMRKKK